MGLTCATKAAWKHSQMNPESPYTTFYTGKWCTHTWSTTYSPRKHVCSDNCSSIARWSSSDAHVSIVVAFGSGQWSTWAVWHICSCTAVMHCTFWCAEVALPRDWTRWDTGVHDPALTTAYHEYQTWSANLDMFWPSHFPIGLKTDCCLVYYKRKKLIM